MENLRYAVVTGATKGIGRAITQCLLQEGYHIIGNYAHDDAAAAEFLAASQVYQDRINLIKCDLSSYDAAFQLAASIKAKAANIEVLVLNSATTDFTPFPEMTPRSWAKVLDTNLNAPAFLIQALGDAMADQTGRIILMGSYVGMGAYPHARSVSYGVSKAGVHALTRYLVKYYSPRGITVNCIAPGTIDTSWHDEKTPEDVAELCMAIIRNQYINGSVINLDGGYSFC